MRRGMAGWSPSKFGFRLSGLLLCLVLVAVSCAPAARSPSAGGQGSAPPSNDGPAPQSTGPKVLRLAMITGSEPSENIIFSASGTGGAEHPFMLHAGLTIYDAEGALHPQLAQRVPTIENGDWKVAPDGQMEVTWRIRPDVLWHDGTPLTSADFLFGLQVAQDPQMPISRPRALAFITEATAPDAHTVVVRWKQPYSFANVSIAEGGILSAIPRHLMGDAYAQGDKQAFANHPRWTREFVGLGPYQLRDWVFGSQMDLVAFDRYFMGKPKIERVVVRYFGDVNTLVANLLSGDVDMTPMGAMKAEQLKVVKNAWEPAGVGTAYGQVAGARNYRFQYRDTTTPWAQDVRVRQAMIHMLDRQMLADTLNGLTTAADTLVPTDDPIYPVLEQKGFGRYPYDLSRAQRLMGDAGWTRGADGLYRSGAGETFNLEVRSSDKTDNVREGQALAGEWKTAGLNTTPYAFPDGAATAVKDEAKATFPGVLGWPMNYTPETLLSWISSQTPTEANRWKGANFGAYTNPRYDTLYDQLLVALEVPQQRSLWADLLKINADDAVSVYLYYDTTTSTVAYRKGIKGVTRVPAAQRVNAWNIHLWDME
jgi:peptide/nickel transport system substrate-binding protein